MSSSPIDPLSHSEVWIPENGEISGEIKPSIAVMDPIIPTTSVKWVYCIELMIGVL